MSNMNSVAGFYSLPAVVVTATSEQAIMVPASGYAGLPSPILIANSGLTVAPSPDIAGSVYDGHPFKVRFSGVASTLGAAATIIPKLRQVNAAAVAVISAAGSVASTGVPGTGTAVLTTGATIASSNVACVSFVFEFVLLWDSVGKSLTGANTLQITNFTTTTVSTAAAAITPVASLNFADLNFMVSFTFSAANATNTVTLKELAVDRV